MSGCYAGSPFRMIRRSSSTATGPSAESTNEIMASDVAVVRSEAGIERSVGTIGDADARPPCR